jgi:hypothetical protein
VFEAVLTCPEIGLVSSTMAASAPTSFLIPSPNRLYVSLTDPPTQYVAGVHHDLELATLEVARLRREVQTLLEECPYPLVQDQVRPKQLQSVLLAKGRCCRPIPSATYQRRSKSARALASSSDTPSWTSKSNAVASRLGGTLGRPLSEQ